MGDSTCLADVSARTRGSHKIHLLITLRGRISKVLLVGVSYNSGSTGRFVEATVINLKGAIII